MGGTPNKTGDKTWCKFQVPSKRVSALFVGVRGKRSYLLLVYYTSNYLVHITENHQQVRVSQKKTM